MNSEISYFSILHDSHTAWSETGAMMGLSTWGYLQEAALAICAPWRFRFQDSTVEIHGRDPDDESRDSPGGKKAQFCVIVLMKLTPSKSVIVLWIFFDHRYDSI